MAKSTKKQKITYDPNKNYTWKPEDEFILTGAEFSSLYNTLREEVQTPAGTAIANKVFCFNILQNLFNSNLENGTIVIAE